MCVCVGLKKSLDFILIWNRERLFLCTQKYWRFLTVIDQEKWEIVHKQWDTVKIEHIKNVAYYIIFQ